MRNSSAWILLCTSAFAIELRKDVVGSFGNVNGCSPDMLRGQVYDLPADTQNIPKLESLKPTGEVCTNWLNIPTRAFLQGIPGVSTRIEWFAIDYQGDFWVETPGSYMFTLSSDDGSMLYIDGKTIIDNDGQHSAMELGGRAKLDVGKHHIRVFYFQGPREYVALVLKVAPPHGIFDFFDMRAYRPPANRKGLAVVAMADESRPILRRATAAHDPLAAKAYESAALTALAANPRPHDFDFRGKAYRFRSNANGGTQCAVTLEVPAGGLMSTPLDGGRVRVHLVMLAVVRDAQGNAVQKISEDFPFEMSAERLSSVKNSTLRLIRLMTLPAGVYEVQAAAVDREGNHASTAAFPIDNTAATGVGLSDLILVRRVEPATPDSIDPMQFENRRVVPELASVVPASAEPSVYFVIYPNAKSSEKPHVVIELALDGRVLGKQSSALPEPDSSGAIPLTIAAPAKPGRNRLRIVLHQGSESVERVLEYLVEKSSR